MQNDVELLKPFNGLKQLKVFAFFASFLDFEHLYWEASEVRCNQDEIQTYNYVKNGQKLTLKRWDPVQISLFRGEDKILNSIAVSMSLLFFSSTKWKTLYKNN